MKIADVLIILGVIAVSVIGSAVTSSGLEWYETINLPNFTPPGSVIGTVWTVLFILVAIAAIHAWRRIPKGRERQDFFAALIVNGILNVGWSVVFFGAHLIGFAIVEALLLAASVCLLLYYAWKYDRLAFVLFVPYLAWVIFATYLTFEIWRVNL